jgi:hypothetical protein
MTVSRLEAKPAIVKLRTNKESIYAVQAGTVEKSEAFDVYDLTQNGKPHRIYHRSIESSRFQGQGTFKKMSPHHIASTIFYTIAPTPQGSSEQKVLIINDCYNTYLGTESKHVQGYSDSNKHNFIKHNGDLLATVRFVIENSQGKIKLEANQKMAWLKDAIERAEISTNITTSRPHLPLRNSNL